MAVELAQIEAKLLDLTSKSHRLLGIYQAQEQVVANFLKEVAELEAEVSLLTLSDVALKQLLKSVSVESLVTIEKLVSYGLRVVFHDQALGFKIDVLEKRKAQWLEMKLIDKGVEAPILDAFGGGPASVVAFLLRLVVCRRLGLSPVLLLDEPFSFVSEAYTDNVSKLLRELCDKLGFTMVLVTHDRVHAPVHATLAYEARETSAGTVFQPLKRRED